jgi:hypothetical protein
LRILSEREFFLSEERIMCIIRKRLHEVKAHGERGVPKVRKPHLSAAQLELFAGEE